MGMAQSSPRPSTRGLTRSLKVNLPTPCDLKTAYDEGLTVGIDRLNHQTQQA